MEVEYDDAKRASVLETRSLDLAAAGQVFDEFHLTRRDEKHSADEERYDSVGLVNDDVVIVTWTPRGQSRRIITMWKADERERKRYDDERARPG